MGAERWLPGHPTQIVFGRGTISQLPDHVSGRTLLITSAGATRRGLTGLIVSTLGTVTVDDGVRPNPTTVHIQQMIDRHRSEPIDTIVAVGGGSVIDTAKVVAVILATPDGALSDLLERPEDFAAVDPIRVVAAPTTAGTGAEVTPTATVWDAGARRKLSAGTPHMSPSVAVVDPDLSDELPWDETLSTGLDALSQCYESICNRASTPETEPVALRGVEAVPPALRALRAGDLAADPRSAMAEAALLSGLAISRTRTGLAHSMSYPITAHLGVPHGLACALSLPGVLAFNAEGDDGRLSRVAAQMGLADASQLAAALVELYRELGVPETLRERIPDFEAVRNLSGEMFTPGRADTNLRTVDAAAIDQVLDHTAGWLGAGE